MRFESSEYRQKDLAQRAGEKRVVKKFLFFPRNFGGKFSRWLEFAYLVEEIRKVEHADEAGSWNVWKWAEIAFADSYPKEAFYETGK